MELLAMLPCLLLVHVHPGPEEGVGTREKLCYERNHQQYESQGV